MDTSLTIEGLMELAVYVDDMAAAHDFYHGILGFHLMIDAARIKAYDVGSRQVLVVSLRGACEEDVYVAGQKVPGHRMDGKGHFAFRIAYDTLEAWIAHLSAHNIEIESEVDWPLGGRSFYFRDPFGNVVELGTAGAWPNDPIADD